MLQVARILGPRGLMPNPKVSDTVTLVTMANPKGAWPCGLDGCSSPAASWLGTQEVSRILECGAVTVMSASRMLPGCCGAPVP